MVPISSDIMRLVLLEFIPWLVYQQLLKVRGMYFYPMHFEIVAHLRVSMGVNRRYVAWPGYSN